MKLLSGSSWYVLLLLVVGLAISQDRLFQIPTAATGADCLKMSEDSIERRRLERGQLCPGMRKKRKEKKVLPLLPIEEKRLTGCPIIDIQRRGVANATRR